MALEIMAPFSTDEMAEIPRASGFEHGGVDAVQNWVIAWGQKPASARFTSARPRRAPGIREGSPKNGSNAGNLRFRKWPCWAAPMS